MFLPRSSLCLCFAAVLLLSAPARAQEQPVLLTAAEIIYDDKANTVTARTDVVLVHDGQTVQADELVYERSSDIVRARGNVRIWQTNGDILTAAEADLSRDLRQAFVTQASLLMSDDSRFIAQEGERTEGRYVRLNRALYTACAPCKEDPQQPPLWQVRAERVIHDTARKDLIYRNATLELGGVPVFYTPYLAHPDPSVKRRSGFLAPVIGSKPNLGFTARSYYYLDVAPSMDATLEVAHSAQRGALLGGQWRHKGAHSDLTISGSATIDDIPSGTGGPPREDKLRGHLFADGSYDLTPNWRGRMSLRHASDDTYTELWQYDTSDVLASSAALEYFTPSSYGVAQLQSFQDLRPNVASAAPQVLQIGWQQQGSARSALGGRWFLGAESRSVTRASGSDSTRASLSANWQRREALHSGVLLTADLNARADTFVATNVAGVDDLSFRPFVQSQLTASLPLIRNGATSQQLIEPLVQLTLAPKVSRGEPDLPNEDSLGLEFDSSNLYRANRFAGFDRVDGGQRLAYGLRSRWQGAQGSTLSASLGQSYDFSRDPVYAVGTGLDTQFSDYVGTLSAQLPQLADVSYSMRLDNGDLTPREHDLRATLGDTPFQLSTNYLYINQTSTSGIGASVREELTTGARAQLSERWALSAAHRRDLRRGDGAITSSTTLTYSDECLTFALIGQRDHIARDGLSSGDSLFFRLILRNLGEFQSPSVSPDLFRREPQ